MPGEESGLEGLLHEKVGGIPAPAIGLIGGGAIIGIIWLRRRGQAQASAATDTTGGGNTDSSLVTYDGTGTVDPNQIDPQTGLTLAQEQYPTGPLDSYLAGNPTSASYPVGLTPQGLPGPVTNIQWARLAGDYLIGKGDDPALVSNALQNFVDGHPLTTAEQAVVSMALRTFGEPPEGILPVTPSPIPGGPPPGQPSPVPVPPPPVIPGVGGSKVVPNVVGMRVANAVGILRNAGFLATFGPRRPGVAYKVTAQNPRAGTRVLTGEVVRRTVRLTIAPETRQEVPGGPNVPPAAAPIQFAPQGFPG